VVQTYTPDPSDITIYYMPVVEPYLTRWCRCHAIHMQVLHEGLMYEAAKLAEQKYRIYLDSINGK